MGNIIYFILPILLIVNIEQNSSMLSDDSQWFIYFVGEKFCQFLILLSFFGKYDNRKRFVLFFITSAYFYEMIGEIYGVNVKGTTFSDIYVYILFGMVIATISLYIRYRWVIRLFGK